ncbi:hypothetical protein F5Y06DRAFT_299481 [Hypoxylon sp. FL0890]|nr:hypothetical protein F5Y06DRAFT_299481 [Hypoxylon sp. FL0890]
MDTSNDSVLDYSTPGYSSGLMFPLAMPALNPTMPPHWMTEPVGPASTTLSPSIPNSQLNQPSMEQMMASKTSSYQGLIRGTEDLGEVDKRYLAIHNRQESDSSDFPLEAKDQQHLIKTLFEAACDCSQAYEPESSQSMKKIKNGSYTDLELELVLWHLLLSIRDAQVGQFHHALKSSKDVVVSLFKDATFKHRLAWRPKIELNNTIGARIARGNGIKTDQNGELVDRNGQKYGSLKKRSAAFEERISKPETKRTRFSSQTAIIKGPEQFNTSPGSFDANGQETIDGTFQPKPDGLGHSEDLIQGSPSIPTGHTPNSIGGTPDSTPSGITDMYNDQSSIPFNWSDFINFPDDDEPTLNQTPTTSSSDTMANSDWYSDETAFSHPGLGASGSAWN